VTLLVVSPDYASHLLPLASIATAWQAAGERVVVATGPANAALVDQFGYDHVELVLGRGSNAGIIRAEDQPQGEDESLRGFFAATRRGMVETLRYQAEARHTDLLWEPVASARRVIEIVEQERPDRILVDHLAFGATLGLQAVGIPYADVVLGHPTALPVGDEVYGGITSWPACIDPELDLEDLEQLRALCRSVRDAFTADWNEATEAVVAGLGRSGAGAGAGPPDLTDAFAVHGDHVLFNYPAELHPPERTAVLAESLGRHTFLGSSIRTDEVDPSIAEWFASLSDRPVVYVSFGSFLSARADVLATVAAALADMDVDVMLASGSASLAELGPLPDRWLVRPSLPQVACLAHADVAVTHGGNNSVTECLHHGVPMVVMPFSTDQFEGAAAIERHGSGISLAPNTVTAPDLAAGIEEILAGPFAKAATAVADHLRSEPGPQRALTALSCGEP
jgi:UDP:flavonoid glycosyltransferase YjiC (YdhE family)